MGVKLVRKSVERILPRNPHHDLPMPKGLAVIQREDITGIRPRFDMRVHIRRGASQDLLALVRLFSQGGVFAQSGASF